MKLGPAEAVALYRATVIGPLMHRVLTHGQLAVELRDLSEQRFRPPGAHRTRTYSVPTLERWLYAFRSDSLAGSRPQPRSDRGFAQDLSEELRTLLLDIRREHPEASVPLILKTLVDDGRLEQGKVSEPTVRRLYVAHGLPPAAPRAPRASVYAARPSGEGAVDEKALRAALTERTRRRASGDNIVSVDGVAWQLDQGYLAGQVVSVARCFVAPDEPPWVEHEGKRLLLHPVDPQSNARLKRPPCGGPAADKPTHPVDFNPARTLGRSKGGGEGSGAGGGAG